MPDVVCVGILVADVVVQNIENLPETGMLQPVDRIDVFLDMGVKTAVIKLGHKGCLIKDSSGEKHYIPAFEGIRAVDTTQEREIRSAQVF